MDENKQRKVVGWLLADRSLYLQTSQFIAPSLFTDPKCRSTLEFVQKFVDEHRQLPSESVFELELGFDPNKEFSSDAPSDVEKPYIIKSMEEFYKEGSFREFLLYGLDMLEKNQMDYGALEQRMKSIVTASMHVDLGMDYFRDSLERLSSVEEGRNVIPIGYPEMDRLLGGWERSELHLIGGATGMGKSIFLTNFSTKNVLDGKHVLTITLELSEKMFGLRYDTIILGKHKDIVVADKDKNAKRLTMINEATGGSLTIKYFPAAFLTTNMLEAYVDQYFITNGRYPDVIYIDYLSLMRPNSKGSNDNSYQREKDVSEELRGFSGVLDVPIISATQLNRSGIDSALPDKSMVSDSFGKIFTVGTLLNICQSKVEKSAGLIKLYADKCRNEQDGWMVNFKINYNTLQLKEVDARMNAGIEPTEAEELASTGKKEPNSSDPFAGII